MLIEVGEKVHVHYRPRYPEDHRLRHLVGTVEGSSGLTIRVRSHLFLLQACRSAFVKTSGLVDEVVSLDDADITVTILPEDLDLDSVHFETRSDGLRLMTSADGSYELPLSISLKTTTGL